MTATKLAPPDHACFQMDPGADTLAHIEARLGGEAATSFVPLFQAWVASGFIGGDQFKKAGDDIVKTCVGLGGLDRHHRVLDIGCGIGRIVLSLLDGLSTGSGQGGSYEGFDVIDSGIRWLRKYVTPKFPAFRFRQAGRIYSGLYNPTGSGDPSRFVFPYRQDSFDFAVGVSVFTHMMTPGVSRYLAQIARTLKPGGRLLCTAYFLDEQSSVVADSASSAMSFPHRFESYRIRNLSLPESAVALDKAHFVESAGRLGLTVAREIRPGSWRKGGAHTGQDIVVLEKGSAR